jgi:hypothetical protein
MVSSKTNKPPRLTPRRITSEATALTNAIVNDDDDDALAEEEEEEEEEYEANSDPMGSCVTTNQTPLVEGEYYATKEAADTRLLLANHALRISFVEHLVLQQQQSMHGVLQGQQQELLQQMEILDGARVGNFLNDRKPQVGVKKRNE